MLCSYKRENDFHVYIIGEQRFKTDLFKYLDFWKNSNNLKSLWRTAYQKFLNPSHPDPGGREKINLNFYSHTSLWYLKRFYEGPKGPKFKFIFILIQLSETQRWEGLIKSCKHFLSDNTNFVQTFHWVTHVISVCSIVLNL